MYAIRFDSVRFMFKNLKSKHGVTNVAESKKKIYTYMNKRLKRLSLEAIIFDYLLHV